MASKRARDGHRDPEGTNVTPRRSPRNAPPSRRSPTWPRARALTPVVFFVKQPRLLSLSLFFFFLCDSRSRATGVPASSGPRGRRFLRGVPGEGERGQGRRKVPRPRAGGAGGLGRAARRPRGPGQRERGSRGPERGLGARREGGGHRRDGVLHRCIHPGEPEPLPTPRPHPWPAHAC